MGVPATTAGGGGYMGMPVSAPAGRTAAVAYSGPGRRWRWVAPGRMHRAGPVEVAYSGLVGGHRAPGTYQAPRLCREAWSVISVHEGITRYVYSALHSPQCCAASTL
eukprot:scaffold71244_cov65-Phaeocystis_antarctica.AAC.5